MVYALAMSLAEIFPPRNITVSHAETSVHKCLINVFDLICLITFEEN